MPQPNITGVGIAVNKHSRKWNYFTLRGTDFDHQNATLTVKDSQGRLWDNPAPQINRPQSSATLLVCKVKVPQNYPLKGINGLETLDITVTNPGPLSDTQTEPDVPVEDEPNP